jgi:MoxR-like ATPase
MEAQMRTKTFSKVNMELTPSQGSGVSRKTKLTKGGDMDNHNHNQLEINYTNSTDLSELSEQLALIVRKIAGGAPSIDEASFDKLLSKSKIFNDELQALREEIKARPEKVIVVNNSDSEKKRELPERHHALLPLLVKVVASDVPVMLVGGAGSAKTSAAQAVAEALNLSFYCKSVCEQTTVAQLLGYMDAEGKYIATDLRRAYENGGVFCLDEVDNGNANVLSVLNSGIANGICSFPDGMIKRHKDFRLICTANTVGHGANAQYVGRNKLDAAFLDRFAVIRWEIDEAFEASLIGLNVPCNIDTNEGELVTIEQWYRLVIETRKRAAALNSKAIISTRALIYGACLCDKVGVEALKKMLLIKGMSADEANKILN